MSASSPVARAASPVDVLVLQYANPIRFVAVPLGILAAVVLVMTAVTIGVVEAGGDAADTDYNGSVLWSIVGFIVGLGAQAVVASFAFALALGSTRRAFLLGTQSAALLQAALLTSASLVLLGLERLTGGWFVGARVLSDATLGGGDPRVLALVMFLTALTALSVGGAFGAAWVRAGAKGPLLLGLALALVITAALLLFLPQMIGAARSFEPWWLVVAAAVVIVLASIGEYLLLLRASVR